MFKQILSSDPLWPAGLACIRILTGFLMAYHGLQMFDRAAMEEFLKWDVVKSLPAPEAMIYLGKSLELFAGLLLALGFLTRFAALAMAVNMLFICFRIGGARFYNEDQHPFLFAVIAMVFFFLGPVKWSIDQVLFKK